MPMIKNSRYMRTSAADSDSPIFQSVPESDLSIQSDDVLSDGDVGNFNLKSEKITHEDDEELSIDPAAYTVSISAATCEDFMSIIYMSPDAADDIPINPIVLERSVYPAMSMVIDSVDLDDLDIDIVAPEMVSAALRRMIPECSWSYDYDECEFMYGDGGVVRSDEGRDVIYSLMNISANMIDGRLGRQTGE